MYSSLAWSWTTEHPYPLFLLLFPFSLHPSYHLTLVLLQLSFILHFISLLHVLLFFLSLSFFLIYSCPSYPSALPFVQPCPLSFFIFFIACLTLLFSIPFILRSSSVPPFFSLYFVQLYTNSPALTPLLASSSLSPYLLFLCRRSYSLLSFMSSSYRLSSSPLFTSPLIHLSFTSLTHLSSIHPSSLSFSFVSTLSFLWQGFLFLS